MYIQPSILCRLDQLCWNQQPKRNSNYNIELSIPQGLRKLIKAIEAVNREPSSQGLHLHGYWDETLSPTSNPLVRATDDVDGLYAIVIFFLELEKLTQRGYGEVRAAAEEDSQRVARLG
jgi:hypothetical protein